MTRTIFWSMAAAAMLAMVADGAANAQQSGKRSGARTSRSGGVSAGMSDGSVRFVQPGVSGGRRTKSGTQKAGKTLTGTRRNTQTKDSNKDKWIDLQSLSW